ncbi:hypothetical protein [Sporosarcina koreensis]|uniref:hypothetical protein n=1 Tax=Sporosarcina koreensis TaxID=334735 RepID=UPI00058B88CA|nr:hypothetical protein [Sporosarcina koreensis]
MNPKPDKLAAAYQSTFDRLAVYLLAVFLSPLLFGACIALYSLLVFDDSWGFGPTALVTAVYSLPFFLFLALPVALFIDFSPKTKQRSRKMKILFYAGAGCLAGLLGAVIFGELFSGIDLGIFGIVGGLAYFSVLELLKLLFHK